MNEAEAKVEAKIKNDAVPKEFCPLINGMCHKDCICWSPSVPRKYGSSGKYITTVPHCGNMMFWRECNP